MDFIRNLEDLKRFLDARQYRWALIGGVALAVYGLARTTLDLDLVVEIDAQEDLADIRYLASLPGVDHEEIRHHFDRHGLLDRYEELKRDL